MRLVGLLLGLSYDSEGDFDFHFLVQLYGSGVLAQFLGGFLHDDLLC